MNQATNRGRIVLDECVSIVSNYEVMALCKNIRTGTNYQNKCKDLKTCVNHMEKYFEKARFHNETEENIRLILDQLERIDVSKKEAFLLLNMFPVTLPEVQMCLQDHDSKNNHSQLLSTILGIFKKTNYYEQYLKEKQEEEKEDEGDGEDDEKADEDDEDETENS